MTILKQLSHDNAVNEAYVKDPLVIQNGSLRGISDMLNEVSILSPFSKHFGSHSFLLTPTG
jgi:hypothetical protein